MKTGCFIAKGHYRQHTVCTVYDNTRDTRRPAGRQKAKSPLHTTQCDTQYTLPFGPMCPNQIEVRQQFVVSMHDLRVYLKINTTTTRLMFSRRQCTCKLCANQSVGPFCYDQQDINHSQTKGSFVTCLVLGLVHNIDSCAFLTHETSSMTKWYSGSVLDLRHE